MKVVDQNPRNGMTLAQIESGMDRWERDAFQRQRTIALSAMSGTLQDGNIPVKAVQRGQARRDAAGYYLMTGYFTILKFIQGRALAEVDWYMGLDEQASLATQGADILLLRDPIERDDFDLRGYSNTPDGISRSQLGPDEEFNPAYPPGAGVPQWRLFAPKRASLVLTVMPGSKVDVLAFSPRDR